MSMAKAITHFVRTAPTMMKMQKTHSRADFFDLMTTKADEQGYGEVQLS